MAGDRRPDDDGEIEIEIERENEDDRDETGDGDRVDGDDSGAGEVRDYSPSRSSSSSSASTSTSTSTPTSTPPGPHDPLETDTSPERQLEDELGRIDLLTTPEGYVEGRVTDLTSIDETTVRLEVTLPHDERVEFTLEKPIPWSEEFLLARIVEDVGYDAASIGHLLGETVYLTRTDIGPEADEDEDGEWLTTSVRAAGDAMLASLSPTLHDYFGSEVDRSPQWRLVDPLERPQPTEDGRSEGQLVAIATAAVLLGTVAAVFGAVFGATGAMLVSITAVAYAIPGLLLVLFGLLVFTFVYLFSSVFTAERE